jgi:hypothetical protein
MQELTEKEIKLYMDLPIKIRENLAYHSHGPVWTKSEYGLGYNLETSPTTYSSKSKFDWNDNLGLTTTSGQYSGLLGSGSQFGSQTPGLLYKGVGPQVGKSTGGGMSVTTALDDQSFLEETEVFSIPYNADDIIRCVYSFVNEFLEYDEVHEDPYATRMIVNGEGGKISLDFQIDQTMSCSMRIEEYQVDVEASSPRELALKLLTVGIEYLAEEYRPSITQLEDVENIYKNENDVNSILLSNQHKTSTMLDSERYSLFITDSSISHEGEADLICRGTIEFVEGSFLIYNKISRNSIAGNYMMPNLSTGTLTTTPFTMTGGQTNIIGVSNPHYYYGLDKVSGQIATTNISKTMATGSPSMADMLADAYDQGIVDKATLRNFLNLDDTTQ